MRVFVIGGFKEFDRALGPDDDGATEDLRRLAGGDESLGDFGLDGIDEQTAPHSRTGSDRRI